MTLAALLTWWRKREEVKRVPFRSEAIIVSVHDELTFPSQALTGYVEALERHIEVIVAKGRYSQYEGREEVSSGLRLVLVTSDALRLCGELSPALGGSAIRYALSIRWSKEPMRGVWQEWVLDFDAGPEIPVRDSAALRAR